MGGYWVLSFFWEDYAVDKICEVVGLSSVLESFSDLELGDTGHFSDVCGMETRISGDDDISLNMLSSGFEIEVIEDCAVELTLSQDVVLVDDLNKI